MVVVSKKNEAMNNVIIVHQGLVCLEQPHLEIAWSRGAREIAPGSALPGVGLRDNQASLSVRS